MLLAFELQDPICEPGAFVSSMDFVFVSKREPIFLAWQRPSYGRGT